MDMKALQGRMGLAADRDVLRKSEELLRVCKGRFDAAAFGIGDICRSVICYELASAMLQAPFDREKAIKLSGLSEKAYSRCFTTIQNALGIRSCLDVRELAVQFGCVRLIRFVYRTITAYKERFLASLPEGRRKNADFGRPVFTAVAFFLCARKEKLKLDKAKLMEVTGTSDPEFSNVATSMGDICFDMVGVEKEKKDTKQRKASRALLNTVADDEDSGSDCDGDKENDCLVAGKKRCRDYELWKETVLANKENAESNCAASVVKKRKQTQLNFQKLSEA